MQEMPIWYLQLISFCSKSCNFLKHITQIHYSWGEQVRNAVLAEFSKQEKGHKHKKTASPVAHRSKKKSPKLDTKPHKSSLLALSPTVLLKKRKKLTKTGSKVKTKNPKAKHKTLYSGVVSAIIGSVCSSEDKTANPNQQMSPKSPNLVVHPSPKPQQVRSPESQQIHSPKSNTK